MARTWTIARSEENTPGGALAGTGAGARFAIEANPAQSSTTARPAAHLDRKGLFLDRVDLSSPVVHEVVIVLHGRLEFWHLPRLLHHLGVFLEGLHFHLRNHGPVTLAADVGHDAHAA